jgi:hypothetical protein
MKKQVLMQLGLLSAVCCFSFSIDSLRSFSANSSKPNVGVGIQFQNSNTLNFATVGLI